MLYSLSLMKDSSGALVAESIARFLPFGAYRSSGSEPVDGNDSSNRGFTGHYENAYIKLIDMRARGYDPAIGRNRLHTLRFSVSWGLNRPKGERLTAWARRTENHNTTLTINSHYPVDALVLSAYNPT
jgi:hypothetical protein